MASLSLPEVSHRTHQLLSGSWAYTLILNGSEVLTSGPFLFQSDADKVGAHFASDPAALIDYLSR